MERSAVGVLVGTLALLAWSCGDASSNGGQTSSGGSGGSGGGDAPTGGKPTSGGGDETEAGSASESGRSNGGSAQGGEAASGGAAAGEGGVAGSGDAGATHGGQAGHAGEGEGGAAGGGGDGQAGSIGEAGAGGESGAGPILAICPKDSGETCHELIVTDNANNVVTYVDEFTSTKAGNVVWSKAVGVAGVNSPRTLQIVNNAAAENGKAVLASVNNGFVELDLVTGTKVGQTTVQFTGVLGAFRIADGKTALATVDKVRVVTGAGVEASSFNLPAGPTLNAFNHNPDTGNFWLSKGDSVYELSEQGVTVGSVSVPAATPVHGVWWRASGGAFITTGDPCTVVELDSAGTAVKTLGGRLNLMTVDYFAGFQPLANGNFMVANWAGHLAQPPSDMPHVIELTPQSKIAWQWGDQSLSRQVNNVLVLR